MSEPPSLARKLGFKPGFRVTFVNSPAKFDDLVGEDVLSQVEHVTADESDLELGVLFARLASELAGSFSLLADRLSKAGMLWVAWPKKSSGVATDMTFDLVQRTGLDYGLVDTKICAIDETWTGLKFVRRLKDR